MGSDLYNTVPDVLNKLCPSASSTRLKNSADSFETATITID